MLWLLETFWFIAVSLDTVQQHPTKTIQVATVLLLATHFAPRWRSIGMQFFFFLSRTTKYIHRHPGQPSLYLHRGGYVSPCSVCCWRHQLVDIHTPSDLKSPCDRVLSFSLSMATATLDSQGSGTSMSIPSRVAVILQFYHRILQAMSVPPRNWFASRAARLPLVLKSCGGQCSCQVFLS